MRQGRVNPRWCLWMGFAFILVSLGSCGIGFVAAGGSIAAVIEGEPSEYADVFRGTVIFSQWTFLVGIVLMLIGAVLKAISVVDEDYK